MKGRNTYQPANHHLQPGRPTNNTLPPPIDERHTPHTGLPPHSSSTGRASSISSGRRRSPRVAIGCPVEKKTKEKRRKGEERRMGTCGEKMGKLHSHPFSTTNHTQAPNFLQPSPYFLSATPNNTEEPETKPPETHKHQHTTNNRE